MFPRSIKITFIVIFLIIIGILYFLLGFKNNTQRNNYTNKSVTNLILTPTLAGSSTYANCQSDSDCTVSGCNKEICQGKNEAPVISVCIRLKGAKYPLNLNYKCSCAQSKCQWKK